MPLTQEHTARYNDARMALAAATHRPADIVNLGGTYAIRVEFELDRYLLATNAGGDLSTEKDGGDGWWTIRFFGRIDGAHELLAAASGEWLVDAFDTVMAELRSSGRWRGDGMTVGSS